MDTAQELGYEVCENDLIVSGHLMEPGTLCVEQKLEDYGKNGVLKHLKFLIISVFSTGHSMVQGSSPLPEKNVANWQP